MELVSKLAAKRSGRAFIERGLLDRGTQSFLGFQCRGALGTRNQVAFEISGARGVQFAVDITVEDGLSQFTGHGWPPGWEPHWPALTRVRDGVAPVRGRTSPCRSASK